MPANLSPQSSARSAWTSTGPSVAAAASLAVRTVGLDIAGVDLVAEDISQPLQAQRGAIVEVNAGPGLLMHLKPAAGTPQPVGRAIVDHLFPADRDCRIPIVGVAGHVGTTPVARLVAHLLALHGTATGLACRDGLFVSGRRIADGDRSDRASGERLLMNRAVDAAVIENGARVLASEGLAYDRCAVGIVTSIDPAQPLPDRDILSVDKLFDVMRTQVDVVLPHGAAILNAADPQVVRMAPLSDGEVIYYAANATLPAIDGHRARGGRSVHTRSGLIVLATGSEEVLLTAESSVPAIADSEAFGLESVLAAVAAAWALGVPPDLIRAGIEGFAAQPAQLPVEAEAAIA